MPGGKFHSPVWTPYALYGTVDYMYGWPAWNSHNGFTAAQGTLNLLESVMYCWYLYVVGTQVVDWSYEGIRTLEVKGRGVNLAVLVGFSGAVMTVSKTLLYCEYFSCAGKRANADISRAERSILWLREHRTQFVVQPDRAVDHSERRMDRTSELHDLCTREGDSRPDGREWKREENELVLKKGETEVYVGGWMLR